MTVSLEVLRPGPAPDLAVVVDAVAARSGAWVVVESAGRLLAHGPGASDCPPTVAAALVSKRTAPLRRATTWRRGTGVLRGSLDGVELSAADLGAGVTAWFLGAAPTDATLRELALAMHAEPLPDDAGFADLLDATVPVRRRAAPPAVLLALGADAPLPTLCRAVRGVGAVHAARLHVHDGVLLAAVATVHEAQALATAVRDTAPDAFDVVVGTATVPPGARDWAAAAAQAVDALAVAKALGRPYADADAPDVALEIVVRRAQGAVHDAVADLPRHPLHRLLEHDARGGDLVATLAAWCRSGFDVPTTAAELHLHPNTLRYRLRRAREISGIDDTQPRQRLVLQLLLATDGPR